jgi:hypothetical protein
MKPQDLWGAIMSLQNASRLLLWLVISPVAVACYAAENDVRTAPVADKPAVRLAPNSFFVEPGVSASLIARTQQGSDAVIHAIVQFTRPVTAQTRGLLRSKYGIVLLEPVPDNAYLATVPRRMLNSQRIAVEGGAPDTGVRAITEIRASEKVSAPLLGGKVAPHVARDGRYAVVVQFFSDVDVEAQRRVLAATGTNIVIRQPLTSAWVIEIAPGVLVGLAEFDGVKWIEPAPGPIQLDNDGVRGPTGINADAVNLSTPYGLSGAGVTIAQLEIETAFNHADFAGRFTPVKPFNPDCDGHTTHVAGTAIGSGKQSAANGGSANQWRGVAFGAKLRGYSASSQNLQDKYIDAAKNAVTITTSSWGTTFCNSPHAHANCYDANAQFYDAATSGRNSDGTAVALARRMLIIGSSGNTNQPDARYVDSNANGQYDAGEAVYYDNENSFIKGPRDWKIVGADDVPNGTPLSNFAVNERYAGSRDIIYRDNDNSMTVSVGDRRLTAIGHYAADTVVAEGDTDIGNLLLEFRSFSWGNTRIPNSAKNTIVVGNYMHDVNRLYFSSSRGPTTDGRLKPDVVGPGSREGGVGGVGIKSTWKDNGYNVEIPGTSFATPAVAGAAAVLTEWYRTTCRAGDPTPSTMRALLIHTAEDLMHMPGLPGRFPGPNYAYGYGAVRLPAAINAVAHHVEGRLSAAGAINAYQVRIGAATNLKVTLAWDDPPWNNAAAASPATGILQNDLDLELLAPDGRTFTPWLLDPSRPWQPAVASTGVAAGTPIPDKLRDRRNTVEQIVVADAMPGIWTIRVLASTMNLPGQDYSVVSDFVEPQLSPCSKAY